MPASARRFALAASVCFLLAACGGGGGGSNDNPNPNPGAPPAAPTALVATPGSAQVTLTWAAVTGATSYNLYFATSAGVTKTSGAKIQGATSGYVHAGRSNNTTYYYVVTAVNAGGESAISSEASATPAVNPAPAAPTNVAAAPANAQVTVSWDPVAGATSYTVYEGGPTVSKSAHAAVVTSATSPVVRSGLANGTPYYYVVTASNLNGESTDSARVSATPFPPPAAPAGVVAEAGDAQVTLTWTAVAGATSYNVYRATSTGVTKSNGMKFAGVSSGVVQTGLTNGTTYYYVVTAVNAGGESADSSEVNARPLPPAPAAPTGVAAVGGDGQVTVTWNAVSGATSYNVYRSLTTGVTKSNGTKFASVTSPLTQSGLSNGTSYYYVVTAENLAGESADSAQASAAPQTVPAAPANVAAAAGNGQVTITWNAAAGATSYNLYRSTTTGVTKSNGMKFAGVSSGGVQTGLTNGTTYYYVVTAVNGAGESADSSQASAMPLPPVPGAPTGVVATPGDGQVTLTWSAVSGASKYNLYRKLGSAPTTSVYDFKDSNVTSPRAQTLANGSIYYFVVTAENVSGESIASSAVSATPSAGAGYNLSGTVIGPHAGGVTMALSGTASRTATTAPDGAYSFAGLPAGSYVVTPSLVGYSFDPPVPTVTISTSNRTQDFSQSSIVPAYTISGSIAYSGSGTGRIYVWALPTGCSSTECAAASTSVSRTGSSTPYSIRGLAYGAYAIIARLDNLGYGDEHATNPTGQAGPVTTLLPVTTLNLALSDPPTPALTAPTGASAMPGDGGVFVMWDAPVDGNGLQIPTSYRVTWGSDTAATNLGSKVVPALMNNWVIVALGSGTYYFKVHAQLGGSDSAAAETGAVVVGAAGAGYSVSGTVTRPSDMTGALYVVVTDDMDVFQWVRIASPAVSQSFTVAGLPNGNYGVYVLLDVNGNGYIDDGDLQAQSTVTVSNANVTGKNATLADAGYFAKLRTSHGKQSGSSGEWYNLTFQVQSVSKQVASVAILSGTGVALPLDLPKKPWSFEAWTNGGMTRPTIGDAYEIEVVYADGTKETGTMSVSGVSDAFPQNLTVQTTTPGSATIPLLKWEAPVSPPGSYNYRVGFFSNAQWWYPDSDVGLPPTTTSALYNADGTATPAALVSGATYAWYVTVRDANGNEAQMQQNYTVADAPPPPPPDVDYSSAIQGTWTACFADPTRDFFITFAFSGSVGTYNEYSYPSTNGTCTGTEILESSEVVTVTLGAGVWSPFDGGPDVAAQQIDYTLSDSSQHFDLVYIDTGAAPNLLYFGDTDVMNGNYPAVINSANPFTKQ